MAATLQLADVRLLAGVTLVVSPRCLIGGLLSGCLPGSDYRAGTSASDRLLPSGSRTSTWRTPLP